MEQQLAIVSVLLGITWAISTIFRSLEYMYWWQLKEYRLDRMRAHKMTLEGRKTYRGTQRNFRLWYLFTIVISFLLVWAANSFLPLEIVEQIVPYYLFVLLFSSFVMFLRWVYELGDFVKKSVRFGWRRPTFTAKALILFLGVTSLIVVYGLLPLVLVYPGGYIFSSQISQSLKYLLALPYFPGLYLLWIFGFQIGYVIGLALLDIFLPFVFAFAIGLFVPFTILGKSFAISRAKNKLRFFPELYTIGITGSYGKSSTKEFLAMMLQEKYKVCKTKKNNNTLIGLARTINGYLEADDQILVAEMGAYKKGEIAAMCSLARPQVSVVAGINEQHLALFGSIEGTMKAKYEIVEALTQIPDARYQWPVFAVFNADDARCVEMATWFDGKKVFYSAKGRYQVAGVRSQVLALDIKMYEDRVEFELVDNRQSSDSSHQTLEKNKKKGKENSSSLKKHIVLKLVGKQNVGNFLAATTVALKLGLSLDQIATAASKMEPCEGTMRLVPGINGSRVIDDSYSTNPDGFAAALEYMQSLKGGRKIVITKGMQELGDETLSQHRKLGERVAKVADTFILLSKNYEEPLRQGLGKEKKRTTKTIVDEDIENVIEFLKNNVKKNDIILLEGRMQGKIMQVCLNSDN